MVVSRTRWIVVNSPIGHLMMKSPSTRLEEINKNLSLGYENGDIIAEWKGKPKERTWKVSLFFLDGTRCRANVKGQVTPEGLYEEDKRTKSLLKINLKKETPE